MFSILMMCLVVAPLTPFDYTGTLQTIEQHQVKEITKQPIVKKLPAKKKTIVKQDYVYPNEVDTKSGGYWYERIKYWCGVHGLSNNQCNTALRIAKAESGYRPCAKFGYKGNVCGVNERILVCVGKKCKTKSSAAGIYMFVNGTRDSNSRRYGYAGVSKYDGDANISVALQIMKAKGFGDWNASIHAR